MSVLFLDTQKLVANYMNKKPEIIFNWQDPYSDSQGILVINSLKNGACGGGTRVSNTLDTAEMIKLSKVMELKFSLYGPTIGGSKSGIKMDPDDPNKYQILERWFRAIYPLLKECYRTAADLNTDFTTISNLLLKLGIPHPQAGILNALKNQFPDTERCIQRMQHLNRSIDIAKNVSIQASQLITGFTIVESIKQFYKSTDNDISQKCAFVQGAGCVGSAAAYYLAQENIKVVALSDKDYGVFNKDGISQETLSQVVKTRCLQGNFDTLMNHDNFNQQIKDEKIDIFVPAAGPYLVTQEVISRLVSNGLEIMVSGANVPFNSDKLYGEIAQYTDKNVAFIPGFVASGGTARAFYSVMNSSNNNFSHHDIFADTAQKVSELITYAMEQYNGQYLATALYRRALNASKQNENRGST